MIFMLSRPAQVGGEIRFQWVKLTTTRNAMGTNVIRAKYSTMGVRNDQATIASRWRRAQIRNRPGSTYGVASLEAARGIFISIKSSHLTLYLRGDRSWAAQASGCPT